MKTAYRSDIKLGERYIDKQTGIEGTAVAVVFHQHGCERAEIECVVAGKIENYGFDSPRLTHVGTQKVASSPRRGGPSKASAALDRNVSATSR